MIGAQAANQMHGANQKPYPSAIRLRKNDVFKKETKKPCRAYGQEITTAIHDANDSITNGQAGSKSGRPKAGQVHA